MGRSLSTVRSARSRSWGAGGTSNWERRRADVLADRRGGCGTELSCPILNWIDLRRGLSIEMCEGREEPVVWSSPSRECLGVDEAEDMVAVSWERLKGVQVD